MGFLIMGSVFTSAQKHLDVVKLKNGNVLKGYIIRQIPGKFLELRTLDKNYWKFDMNDIAEISSAMKRIPKIASDSIPKLDKGLFYELQLGVLVGNKSNSSSAPFSLLASANYLFNDKISIGGGIGYESFEQTQMPVFGSLQYHTRIKGMSSYIFCHTGYSFSIDNRDQIYYSNDNLDSKGGWLLNPGVGFIIGNRSTPMMTLSIGYRFQKIKHKWENTYTQDTEYLKEKFNRLSIHLGIIF
ncbi:hypothetical protein DLK05_11315 [Ancylomarina longa]|uniref:Outer membrane protein beta-barrel domain-containing protein n=2 Tax=Ancylomarina longa TaxID=2487017 RepID=A0A434ATQ3_9BACT|nr:hypothetical protein DLK05_11315 [Ancylomarina longa]